MEKPSLRIALTGICNLKCQYCPRHGDNYRLENKDIALEDLEKIIKIAYERGIRCFSITGGEPLLVPERTFYIANVIRRLPDIKYLKLNTNGIYVKKYINEIKKINFDQIKISLDTLDDKTFEYITGKKTEIQEIKDGISELKKYNIPIRLQTVVGKFNINQIEDIIEYCEENKLDIKIFDITYYEDSNSLDKEFWKENFIPLEDITNILKKRYKFIGNLNAVGGFGHSMTLFQTPGGIKIQGRDCNFSSYYSEICNKCPKYICQDGLCNITLTADGRIKICRNDGYTMNMIDKSGHVISDLEIQTFIDQVLSIFDKSKRIDRSLVDLNLPSR